MHTLFPRIRRLFLCRAASRRASQTARDRQAGFSATELLVFTAPLCILAMVLSSKLAATSSARLKAQQAASVAAQLKAASPCGGNARLNAPFHPEAEEGVIAQLGVPMLVGSEIFNATAVPKIEQVFAKQNRVRQGIGPLTKQQAKQAKITSKASAIAGAINVALMLAFTVISYLPLLPEDILTSPELVETNWATQSASAPVGSYHFSRQADALIPGPPSISASATFVCNEPDDGAARREEKEKQLVGFAVMQANGIYF